MRIITLQYYMIVAFLGTLFITGPFLDAIWQIPLLGSMLGLISILGLIHAFYGARYPKIAYMYLILALYTILSFAYSLMLGNNLNEAIRSLVPLLVLSLIAVVVSAQSDKNVQKLNSWIFAYGVFTALSIFPFFMRYGITGALAHRLTAFSANAHTPAMLISLALLPIIPIRKNLQIAIAIVIVCAIILTRSRGQLIVCAMLLLAMATLSPTKKFGKTVRIFSLCLLLLLGGVLIILADPANSILFDKITRLHSASGHETYLHRIAELKSAAACFSIHPVMGCGAGHMFVFFSPVEHAVVQQNYIHNYVMYTLAKFGIVGFFILSLTILAPLMVRNRTGSPKIFYVKAALISLILYSLVSASYKSIQASIFIAVLACAIVGASRINAQFRGGSTT